MQIRPVHRLVVIGGVGVRQHFLGNPYQLRVYASQQFLPKRRSLRLVERLQDAKFLQTGLGLLGPVPLLVGPNLFEIDNPATIHRRVLRREQPAPSRSWADYSGCSPASRPLARLRHPPALEAT